MEISENTLMPFGKYKGEKLANVPASYLVYLSQNGHLYGDVGQYVKENWDLLKEEADKTNKHKGCDATESDIY